MASPGDVARHVDHATADATWKRGYYWCTPDRDGTDSTFDARSRDAVRLASEEGQPFVYSALQSTITKQQEPNQ